MLKRTLLGVAVLVFPIAAMAQKNDFAVWVNTTSFKSSTVTFPGFVPATANRTHFDRRAGYGLSFNRYVTPNLSAELAFNHVRGDWKIDILQENAFRAMLDVGSFRSNQYGGLLQWHFAPRSLVDPYLGAGATYIHNSHRDSLNNELPPSLRDMSFESKLGFTANAGVNFAITQSVVLALDGRYTPYTAKDTSSSIELDHPPQLDPLTISAGFRFRF